MGVSRFLKAAPVGVCCALTAVVHNFAAAEVVFNVAFSNAGPNPSFATDRWRREKTRRCCCNNRSYVHCGPCGCNFDMVGHSHTVFSGHCHAMGPDLRHLPSVGYWKQVGVVQTRSLGSAGFACLRSDGPRRCACPVILPRKRIAHGLHWSGHSNIADHSCQNIL